MTTIVRDNERSHAIDLISLHKLVVPNGRIGLITSNSWLGTSWGKVFLTALTQSFIKLCR